VRGIRPGGAADDAKPSLEANDVILSVDGEDVKDAEGLITLAERVVRGRVEPLPVLVAFDRRGQRMLTVLELARPGLQDPGMEARKAWIPVVVQAITPELGQKLGVPDRASERAMLLGMDRREILKELKPVFTTETLREIQAAVRKVHTSPALLDYLQDLLDASRQRHSTGLSPRAGLALLHGSQSWALMHGRDMVLPEDIQAVGLAVMGHRVGHDVRQPGESGRTLAEALLRSVPVP
jgi:hypothetical protein